MTQKTAPSLRLLLALYPFCAAAVAINLFLLFLMFHGYGVPALRPLHALYAAVPLGIPATWFAGRWVRRLIDRTEGR